MATEIKWIGSPNRTIGRGNYRPEAVVIHIMEGTLHGTDTWFKTPASKVSAHYGVGKNGEVHQYVDELNTAWHAGRVVNPTWALIKKGVNPNLYTVGIEHEGHANSKWTDEMYNASALLISAICQRWGIILDRNHIVGHHEIYAPKTCPGLVVSLDKLILLASLNYHAPEPSDSNTFVV